jgi:hypothetical protein
MKEIWPIKRRMLAEPYVEALLINESLADKVWALWDSGTITDELAAWAYFYDAIPRNDLMAFQFDPA